MEKRTRTQEHDLARMLLEQQKYQVFSGISARGLFSDRYGIDIDWHVYSEALQELESCGMATLTKPGGYCEYMINHAPDLSFLNRIK